MSSSSTSSQGIDTPATVQSTSDDIKPEEVRIEESKAEDDKVEEETKMIKVGMLVETKDLYAKYDENGDRSWSENPPDGLEEAAENETTKKFAIIVRKSTFNACPNEFP
ncbi:hypothetical protein NQ176_g4284 [Zarea fungicola]|uniref:Uncharacterized protein n=1 Tax=Zarea fungicola TaxID=93591 RepID=A0ACC1NE41_9HYPO|nr:hypothetical protein NQ176_g4284 [Lecanicillium fungicola]